MGNIKSEISSITHENADGTIVIDTTERTIKIERNTEPDYIKLYTKMWCEFNAIPDAYRELFMQLVCRMSYCNSASLESSQLVNTGKPWSDDIMKALNWKKSMYMRGLSVLCECGAIRKVGRGVYQINANYAGRGEWKYNPRLERGGVEDLVATFNFNTREVSTKIKWAAEGSANPETGLEAGESLTFKHTILGKEVV